MQLSPAFDAFESAYAEGRNQAQDWLDFLDADQPE